MHLAHTFIVAYCCTVCRKRKLFVVNHRMLWGHNTVAPPITDPPTSGQPLYNGHQRRSATINYAETWGGAVNPRIYGRPSITERPYFLGNIAGSSIFCRSQVHANDHRLSFWDGSKYNILLTCPPWRFQKNGNDYFRRKSKSFLVNIEIGKTTAGNRSTGVTDKYLNNSQLVWYCSQCKP